MSITYLDAIREAQEKALRDDPRVYIYGQDVAVFGGAFKATRNLAKEFPGRVMDAPISEDAMVGSAIGAAIEGMRPIVEMQFADFSAVAFNQIVNQAATLYWRTQVACPITIRLPSGSNPGSGPFHSQTLESIYSHFPGLVVMTPATVEDAYTMLLEAIKVDDPVIFCEHKYLYNRLKIEALPDTNLPFDTARIARPGRDISIVAYSSMVHEALSAAELLHKANIEAEVVDLRCIKPLDVKTVLESVARTARLLCVGESWPWGGVNSEVITSVVTHGFHLLDAPPQRINSKDTPVPFHPNLLGAHKPSSQVIAAAARRLCDW
ncbi:MAG TPA: transketolase C-terminal domain-containing protein [Chthoniobacterales bacterium]|jgi:pyruvate dehydrogenase E1 component beta subunit/2-oxoisovalerate dehydrogenase E1 component beta subunit|nr:transketolase C-terminal domain-containing protein [Chthoniobacterales bacterium]